LFLFAMAKPTGIRLTGRGEAILYNGIHGTNIFAPLPPTLPSETPVLLISRQLACLQSPTTAPMSAEYCQRQMIGTSSQIDQAGGRR
jgi:hypothetical protein